MTPLEQISAFTAGALLGRACTIATAESCTGGLLAKSLTDFPGSSNYFLRGYVTYSNAAKDDDLSVAFDLLADHGAVSEPVAEAMADGCRRAANSDYALAVTGIAGPGGGSPEKPVGLVFVALAENGRKTEVSELRFGQDLSRAEIRERTCEVALNVLLSRIKDEVT